MANSDQDGKRSGLPSWQLKPSNAPEDEKSKGQDTAPQPPPSRASIIEKARKFLEEDEVRNASTDKQIAFLESKGLESHEIEQLLGVIRNVEATNSQAQVNSLLSATI